MNVEIEVRYTCVCGYTYKEIQAGKEQGNRAVYAIEHKVVCPQCGKMLYPHISYEVK